MAMGKRSIYLHMPGVQEGSRIHQPIANEKGESGRQ
jgi:hypothetical protein